MARALPSAVAASRPARCLGAALAVAALCGALANAGAASAATFTVNDQTDAALENPSGTACASTHGGSCTLRAAAQAADNSGGASTITLPAGDYRLTIPSTAADDPATGDLDIKGASTALTISGSGATNTIIDANHIDRAFSVQREESLSISGVTIRNGAQPNGGAAQNSTAKEYAGAVYSDGRLSIAGCVLIGNSSAAGGGAVVADSQATSTSIVDSTVEHNASEFEGGAIDVAAGPAALTGDTITHNTSRTEGGALFAYASGETGSVTIGASTISDNVSGSEGGALYMKQAGALTVSNSTLNGNSTGESAGGAISDTESGAITIENSTLSRDDTGDAAGGAIAASTTGRLSVSGSNISDDTAGNGNGGALYVNATDLTLTGSRLDGDQGAAGGAIYLNGTGAEAQESITAATFAEDSATDDEGGAIYDQHGDLEASTSTFTGNRAGSSGGALYYVSQDGLSLTNDTFDGNQAGSEGGAISVGGGAPYGEIVFLNDTITRNTAYDGGGVYAPSDANTIENTIIAGNFGGLNEFGGEDCWGLGPEDDAASADKGGNIDGDGSCFSHSVNGDQLAVDPLLAPLATNGGPTETDAPMPGSPAIAHGVSSPLPCPAADERGVTRAGGCNVGAYQAAVVQSSGAGPASGSGRAARSQSQCKSTRSETISWKLHAGIHLKRILVTVNGKSYRRLAGGARRVRVGLAGRFKGTAVVRITGFTSAGTRYVTIRTFHLCVPAKSGQRLKSRFLTRA